VVKQQTPDKDCKNTFTNVTITLTKLRLLMLTAFAISIANSSGKVVKQATHDQDQRL
jgi:hypothetical protein